MNTRLWLAAILTSLLTLSCQSLTEPGRGRSEKQLAKAILEATGIRGGLIVHLGCGQGTLTAALRANDSYLVHGLDGKPENVKGAREYIKSQGCYGPVSVDHLAGGTLPYVDNLVNLVVVEAAGEVPMAEIQRVLVPNGVAYVKQQDGWSKIAKPRSDNTDEWTHSLHDPSNNPVAHDQVVGPPRHLQWICNPAWSKHHEVYPPTIPFLISSGGRIIYFQDETPAAFFNVQAEWHLVARDAYNGTLLWRRPAPEWSPETWPGDLGGGLSGGPDDYRRRLIAVGDRLYVTLGRTAAVTEIDAATGEVVSTVCPGAVHLELMHEGETLFVVTGPKRNSPDRVTAYHTPTGRKLWEAPGGRGMALAGDRLYFMADQELVAVDAGSGKEIWRSAAVEQVRKRMKEDPGRPQLGEPLRAAAGVVLSSLFRSTVAAFSAESGSLLWTYRNHAEHTGSRGLEAWIIDGLIWVPGVDAEKADDRLATVVMGLNPLTGKVTTTVPAGAVFNTGHHRRCYPGKATDQFLIFSRRGAEFLELDTADVNLNNWTRGTCGFGVMPSNGLLYSPPHACRCYSEAALRGLHALAPGSRGPDMGRSEDAGAVLRLEQGPAYGFAGLGASPAGGAEEWPTYRHDPERSGSTPAEVPASLKQRWQVQFGGRITSPVLAKGKIYVAATDTHTLHALKADDGSPAWTYTAGGRIDTPPTIHDGLALFGCSDGWVYCLRADDGRLVWRFRSTRDLRLSAEGQLESVWPVHGAVLVRDDVVYFATGRSSFLDGGIFVYGLEIASGKQLYKNHLDGPWTDAGSTRENPNPGFVMPGSLPDVLVSDEERLYMRHMAFDAQLKQAEDMLPNFYEAPERTRENFGGDHKYWCDLLEVGPRAFVGKPEWYYRSYFNNFPGRRLYSTSGILDESWHVRSYWSFGQVVGQYVVFDGNRGYAVRAYPNAARWISFNAGQGYELYSGDTAVPSAGQKIYALRPEECRWSTTLPFRPKAMVLAGGALWLSGPPDPSDPAEALAALQGKRGAHLWAVAAGDGKTLAKHRIESLPLFDGMIAAGRQLYLSTVQGALMALGPGQ